MLVSRFGVRFAGLVTFVAVFATAADVQAGWHHRYRGLGSAGGSYGSAGGSYGSVGGSAGSAGGSYGSAGGSGGSVGGSYGSGGGSGGSSGGSYGSAGGSSGGWGSHGLHRRALRHWRHGSYGGSYSSAVYSTGGSSGGGSSGGSYGGSSGGSYGGSYGGGSYGGGSYGGSAAAAYGGEVTSGYSSGMPIESYRVYDETPSMTGGEIIGTPVAPLLDSTRRESVPADGALLIVQVPADAKVFVNGDRTSSTGEVRRFLSRGLEQGRSYEFVVRMSSEQGGAASEQTRVVTVTAGGQSNVSFAASAAKPVEPTTSLTLRVPSDARVYLAGNPTSSSGEVRQFETSTLKAGQEWKNYEVRVVTVVDGREREISKVINLSAGDRVELTLNPAGQLASLEATAAL
jgi:uncharacterized protein (TIGR03000 family)